MAPRTHRSIVHRPVDKISQLLAHHGSKAINHQYDSSYQCSFQPADQEVYLSGHIHPIINGYYTQVKNIIEQNPDEEPIELLGRSDRKESATGGQRNLESVRNLSETKRLTHGIVTASDMDMRKIMYPACEEEGEQDRESKDQEVESLKLRTHGTKSNSDPTGGRTWKALKYEACAAPEEKVVGNPVQQHRRSSGNGYYKRVQHRRANSNLIVNRDLDVKFLSLQEAIHYLNKVRSALIKKDKSAIDICRKTETQGNLAEDAIQMLSSAATVHIDYSKIRPVIDILNLEHVNLENIQKLWDLFDHHVPLSGYKFGRLIKPFQEDCSQVDFRELQREPDINQNHLMEMRFRSDKFKDYDTAGDLISPKPGTSFGLGHVDYFLPRRSEDIKTIFRNFDLDERTFSDAWKKARKLETCDMNKVSAESFRTILKKKDVKLLY
ncbi:uncharacterized protein LOC135705717 [Ochlerotatus camptorhynchus]|uniref:uncharacterized protein LOC135705717 n=1 Tax=Ochlerotatus camptorhynchus TaxID=644619 RepID=UPI0031DFBC6A